MGVRALAANLELPILPHFCGSDDLAENPNQAPEVLLVLSLPFLNVVAYVLQFDGIEDSAVMASEDEVGNLRDPVAGDFVFQHVEILPPTRACLEIEYGFLRDFLARSFDP
ncbi:MAG: hypothetical protein Q9163_002288 [Psora crenata]